MKIQTLILGTWLLGGTLIAIYSAEDNRTVTFYSPDRNHIWNRLYAHLCIRTANDGEVYSDLLDPPFWARTKYLRSGEANKKAISLLGDFIDNTKARDAMTPLQRAMMQRDLIAIFCWLTGNRPGDGQVSSAEQALARSLVRAIRSIALTAVEIHQLPSTYSTTVGLGKAPSQFDPDRPDVAFLPTDLLDDNGPWLLLEPKGDDWLAATVHFKAFQGRSAFEVRFRHAEGRASGERYLNELASMQKPLLFEKPSKPVSILVFSDGPWINPDTPQFPANSAWALIRRAVLLDHTGLPVLSPIIESVQLRVDRSIDPHAQAPQSFFEWELRRGLLFGHGGMRETLPGENRFPHFMGKGFDPFEEYGRIGSNKAQLRLDCFQCHSGVGIYSINSRLRLFEERPAELPIFTVVSSARIAQITELTARLLPEWTLLRWLGTEE